MTNFAGVERLALCDTLARTGPDAPTLCAGWRTQELAAHLMLRERRPDAQLGMLVPALAGRTDALLKRRAADPFDDLVAAVRTGPPAWHPTRIAPVDQTVNTVEFFVHHEDVLRAEPGWSTPRALPEAQQRALWLNLRGIGRLTLRKARVGVELVADGHGSATAHRGEPLVRVHGTPAELLLFAFGRRSVAQVRLDGAPNAVASLTATPSGL